MKELHAVARGYLARLQPGGAQETARLFSCSRTAEAGSSPPELYSLPTFVL